MYCQNKISALQKEIEEFDSKLDRAAKMVKSSCFVTFCVYNTEISSNESYV